MPLSILDASIRDRLEPILLREAAVLRERLSELQKRRLIRSDADLQAASLMVSGQAFYLSFMLRVCTNLDDTHLRQIISQFAQYMARGLGPLPQ